MGIFLFLLVAAIAVVGWGAIQTWVPFVLFNQPLFSVNEGLLLLVPFVLGIIAGFMFRGLFIRKPKPNQQPTR